MSQTEIVEASALTTENELFSKAALGKRRLAAVVALAATAVCLGWLGLEAKFSHQGNWTSVYYIGSLSQTPQETFGEKTYRVPDVVGYDGQFFHLMAHDPLMKRDVVRYFDAPRMRYRRILVPALAHLLALGQDRWVDPAYLIVILAFIGLGTYWASRWAMSRGYSAFWGLLFLLLPSTLVTLLTFVVDGVLGALTMGFIWFAERKKTVPLFIVLTLAALTRETGILLPAGYCLYLLIERKFSRAVIFGTSVIPAFAWACYVQAHAPAAGSAWLSWIPFSGLYWGIVEHFTYKYPYLVFFDFVALTGMVAALAMVAYYTLRKEAWHPATFVAAAFLFFAAALGKSLQIWPEVNSFGRCFTPVLLFVAVVGITRRNWWALLPTAMIDLRILMIFAAHGIGVMQGILGETIHKT